MDEREMRLAAVELVIVEVLAGLDPEALDDASRSIRAGLEANIASDERTICHGALQLIQDARARFVQPAVGFALRPIP